MLFALSILLCLSPAFAWPVSTFTPSGTYAPIHAACPANHSYVRPASAGLNPDEAAWRKVRVNQVIPAIQDYLERNPIPDFDVDRYISQLWSNRTAAPVLAFTFSGGGWRSAYPGLGLYDAMDGRNPQSVAAGTGGLYQAMTYQGGLSGGTIATAGLAISGYPPLADLIASNSFNGSLNASSYDELELKAAAGFNVTGADILGSSSIPNVLMTSRNHGVDPMAYTWSGIQTQESFSNGSHPMPFIVAAEVIPQGLANSTSYNATGRYYNGTVLLPFNNTIVVYEFTPWEFGSWVGRVPAFADLHYLGTPMNNGSPVNACVEGFDTAVFVIGAAEDSLSDWTVQVESGGVAGQFYKRSLPGETLTPIPADFVQVEEKNDVESVIGIISELPNITRLLQAPPQDYFYGKIANPFRGWNGVSSDAASQDDLLLVDAGMAHQESPLFPLIQPARGVDLIITSDACNELPNGWQNGTSLISSARLAALAGLPFPSVPSSVNTMLNLGYTAQPVFFGCNDSPDVPLILYAADYPYSAYSNLSILDSTPRTKKQVELLTGNQLPLFSQQGFRDNWNECLACGVVYRSLQRMGAEMPDRCKQCMVDYCWNGTEVNSSAGYLQPSLALDPTLDWDMWNSTVFAP